MKEKEGGRYGKQVKSNTNQFATNNYNLTESLHNMIQYYVSWDQQTCKNR